MMDVKKPGAVAGRAVFEIQERIPISAAMNTTPQIHKRLQHWRDEAIRRPQRRPVYAHMLMVAHMTGRLVADDHPGWMRIEDAIRAARAGDASAIDTIEREISRMMGDGAKPPSPK